MSSFIDAHQGKWDYSSIYVEYGALIAAHSKNIELILSRKCKKVNKWENLDLHALSVD
jgi:hypothetical protein